MNTPLHWQEALCRNYYGSSSTDFLTDGSSRKNGNWLFIYN